MWVFTLVPPHPTSSTPRRGGVAKSPSPSLWFELAWGREGGRAHRNTAPHSTSWPPLPGTRTPLAHHQHAGRPWGAIFGGAGRRPELTPPPSPRLQPIGNRDGCPVPSMQCSPAQHYWEGTLCQLWVCPRSHPAVGEGIHMPVATPGTHRIMLSQGGVQPTANSTRLCLSGEPASKIPPASAPGIRS